MKNQIFCFLVFLLLIHVSQSKDSQIALLDCEGNFFAFPKVGDQSAVALNLQTAFSTLNMFQDRYVDRFSCVCPDATKSDVNKIFNSFWGWTLPEMWINAFSNNPQRMVTPTCPFGQNGGLYGPSFALPSTCNYDQEGECFMYYEITKSVTFQVAIAKCPNSNLPFISVNCNGTGCDTLGLPCVDDSECQGALTCNPFLVQNQPFPGKDSVETKDLLDTIMLSRRNITDSCDDPMGLSNTLANHVRTAMYNKKSADLNEIKYCGPGVLHYETIVQDLNRTTRMLDCADPYDNQGRMRIDCIKNHGPLTTWDGMTNEGFNILKWRENHPFTVPSTVPKPRTPGAVVIADITCEEQYQILPGSKFGLAVQTRKIIDLYNVAYDAYRNRLNCESKNFGFKLDDTIFAANYYLPSLFAALTAPNWDIFHSNWIGDEIPTWAGYNFAPDSSGNLFKFPSTCDYNTWKNDGKCEATYDGLSSLFGIDITINVALSKCDYREFPNLYVECVGVDCNQFEGLVSCNPNDISTCPNAECINSKDLINEISQMANRQPYDFVAETLGFVTPQCPVTNTTLLNNDINAIMNHFGVSGHICFPSLERLQQTANGWVQTQYYQSNGKMVLSDLGPWKAPSRQ